VETCGDYTYSAVVIRRLFLSGVLLLVTSVLAQQCPQPNATEAMIPSEARTLEGRLLFHDGIRKWFELKLDQPQCGQRSIQLVSIKDDWKPIEVLRGCRIKSKGDIDFSLTGYFSLALYQEVDQIEAVGFCPQQLPFPDYSKAKPDKSIHEYRVDMYVNYTPGDHPIIFRVSHAGKELLPWQAYASYTLTGGFVLYGHCADGFAVDKVFGTPQANPAHFTERGSLDDRATFDPEGAAASGKKDLHLVYTCIRM